MLRGHGLLLLLGVLLLVHHGGLRREGTAVGGHVAVGVELGGGAAHVVRNLCQKARYQWLAKNLL